MNDKIKGTTIVPGTEGESHGKEDRFAMALRFNNSWIFEYNAKTGGLTIIPENLEFYGYGHHEIPGTWEELYELIHPGDLPAVRQAVEDHLTGKKSEYHAEFRIRTKSGDWVWGCARGQIAQRDDKGDPKLIVGVFRDINDRKQSEIIQMVLACISSAMADVGDLQSLLASIREELGKVTDTGNFMMVFLDEKAGLFRVPFGVDEKDDITAAWKIEKTLTGRVVQENAPVMMTKEELLELQGRGEVEIIGSIPEIWLGLPVFHREKMIAVMVIQSYDNPNAYDKTMVSLLGIIARSLGIFIHRKEIETRLELVGAALEHAGETVVITDSLGDIQYVNPAFEKITGYTREEVLGGNPRILKSGRQDMAFYQGLWSTITDGRIWHGKMVNRRKDGALYTEQVTISPILDKEGKIGHYVAVKRDITQEETLAAQLRQAQKMESIGLLAGGVAHDFNNMLGVILGYSEIAMADLSPGDQFYEDFQEIRKAAERSADLTRQLLAFSRQQIVNPRTLDLNDFIPEMLKMLRRLVGENIQLVWKPCAGIASVYMDPVQIDQILANLCVNARDAIDDSGSITIEIQRVVLDEEYCRSHLYAVPGNYVMLGVSDDGCGMDGETKARIFDPFFTTKELGKGTGLGLSTVYGIVKQNDGIINAYSEPGRGTTFKIYFHEYGGESPEENMDEAEEMPRGRGELILLVEDESAILKMTQLVIEKMGYSVIAAETPREALELARDQGCDIKLLMTDVVMPGTNGKDLADEIKGMCPEIEVLFMSGYTSEIIARRGVLADGVNFISKPFSSRELAEQLWKIFRRASCTPGESDFH